MEHELEGENGLSGSLDQAAQHDLGTQLARRQQDYARATRLQSTLGEDVATPGRRLVEIGEGPPLERLIGAEKRQCVLVRSAL